jgi:hypothetical protein
VPLQFISRGLAGLIPVGDPSSQRESGACKAQNGHACGRTVPGARALTFCGSQAFAFSIVTSIVIVAGEGGMHSLSDAPIASSHIAPHIPTQATSQLGIQGSSLDISLAASNSWSSANSHRNVNLRAPLYLS